MGGRRTPDPEIVRTAISVVEIVKGHTIKKQLRILREAARIIAQIDDSVLPPGGAVQPPAPERVEPVTGVNP